MLVISIRAHGVEMKDLCVEFYSNSSPNLTRVSKQGIVFRVLQNGCALLNMLLWFSDFSSKAWL